MEFPCLFVYSYWKPLESMYRNTLNCRISRVDGASSNPPNALIYPFKWLPMLISWHTTNSLFFWLRVSVCVFDCLSEFFSFFYVFFYFQRFDFGWFWCRWCCCCCLVAKWLAPTFNGGRCCCVEIKYREREMERRNKRVNKAETLQMLSFEFSFCLVNILWNVLLFMVDTFAHHFEYHDHQNRWKFSQNTNRITAISEFIY